MHIKRKDELCHIVLKKEIFIKQCLTKLYDTNKQLIEIAQENALLKKQLEENNKFHVKNNLNIVNNAEIMLKKLRYELQNCKKTLGAEALNVGVKIKICYYFSNDIDFVYSIVKACWHVNDIKHIRISMDEEKGTFVDLKFRYLNDSFEYIVEDQNHMLYKISII